MSAAVAYLDASAVVKLFKREAESSPLATALAGHELWVASELVTVEAACVARRLGGEGMVALAQSVVARVELIPCTGAIRGRAAASFSVPLRALDAIHAASALSMSDEIASAMVYDADLGAALEAEGLTVASPAAGV
ncbi:MAG: PIN domain-containing protein [Actinomycetota bacterium]|nr:PIN domain-containing protein [Actinomycetota bacterium]